MILHPGILALLVSSLLVSTMVVYSAVCGIGILRNWDISSGSERQLLLERKTYLISTILAYFLGFQLISLFLFIHTADNICPLFTGAMCAVGTLSANPFGYPTLLCKVAVFILAGLWLILNHVDSRGCDYPLIKTKYRFLLGIAPIAVAETILQGSFFLNLKPDVITSCCGSLFGTGGGGPAAELAALPAVPAMIVFYSVMALTTGWGIRFYLTGKEGALFAGLSGITCLVSMASVISFISLYFYELPTHHCPFCILQREYIYIGYPLYLFLLTGTVFGLGVGLLGPFRGIASLSGIIPSLRKKLTLASLVSYLIFTAIVTWPVLFSSFRLTS
jgi:hypothetical protein